MKKRTNFLPLNLQLFAEGEQNTESTNTSDPEQKPKDHMIPKTRFDEVNTKLKSAQEQLDALLAEKKAAEVEAQKRQGQYEDLYTTATKEAETIKAQAQAHEARAAALEAIMTEMLTAKLAAIPEELRDIIPDNLTSEAKLSWIDRAQAKGLFGVSKANTPLGGATNPALTQIADLSKLTPFQLLKAGYGSK